MARVYTCRFRVRHYELDSFGHVNNAVYANYLEQAAIEASADAGYDTAWYRLHHSGWIIRRLWIKYLQQAYADDDLEIRTWVADFRQVRSHREYDVRRLGDNSSIVRARADWVYIDAQTLRPTRIPEEMGKAFDPTNHTPPLQVLSPSQRPVEKTPRYTLTRTVQRYELDTWGHVNHANYLRWIEQAVFTGAARLGYPVERMYDEGWLIFNLGHEIEYFHPAYDGDEVEIVAWISHVGRVRGAWTVEVRRKKTGELLARDVTPGAFITLNGRPRSIPEGFLAAVDVDC